MSIEKDSMLRVRLTQRQSDELDNIIDELQAQIPEASVTTSSIARHALEKYVSDHIAKRDGTKIFIEVSTAHAAEIEEIEDELRKLLPLTGYKLHTMPGIDLVTESQLISEIGDINRFPDSDKLARFMGLAPVQFSSAGKGKDQRCRNGNRALNAIFHFLAIQMVLSHRQESQDTRYFENTSSRRSKRARTSHKHLCVWKGAS